MMVNRLGESLRGGEKLVPRVKVLSQQLEDSSLRPTLARCATRWAIDRHRCECRGNGRIAQGLTRHPLSANTLLLSWVSTYFL